MLRKRARAILWVESHPVMLAVWAGCSHFDSGCAPRRPVLKQRRMKSAQAAFGEVLVLVFFHSFHRFQRSYNGLLKEGLKSVLLGSAGPERTGAARLERRGSVPNFQAQLRVER